MVVVGIDTETTTMETGIIIDEEGAGGGKYGINYKLSERGQSTHIPIIGKTKNLIHV